MSLDVSLVVYVDIGREQPHQVELYSANITHNLNRMAEAAGIYKHLWRPDEIGITEASQLIKPLSDGLRFLRSDPKAFRIFNPDNGWGTYEVLCEFVEEYIIACEASPKAKVEVAR